MASEQDKKGDDLKEITGVEAAVESRPKQRPKVRFFLIHSMPRAASTSFRMWMNSTMGCVCHGEILGDGELRGTSHKQQIHWTIDQRNARPKEFFLKYFWDHTGHAVGFKALSSHLLDPNNFKFLGNFFHRKPFVINLYRRNLIDRFSSTKFHRMQIGFLKPEEILKLTATDVLMDCSETVEHWNSAIISWATKLDYINLDIQNITDEQKHVIERKLRIWLDEPLGKANSNSGKSGREIFADAAAHLEAICADPMLDPFRNVDLGPNNLIYALDNVVLPASFESPYAKNSKNDLTKIDGVNRILELRLNQNKIYFFKQIAGWDEKVIHAMSCKLGYPVNPAWIEQAKELQAKKT